MLALLQTGRRWTVADLAGRLNVAPRTVRRDVAWLRTLGYDVQSHPGLGGAYVLRVSRSRRYFWTPTRSARSSRGSCSLKQALRTSPRPP
ncbi:HTH domain-containing protein [Devriesea agamarum]|uniref:HTH domain-containing protein n=1 Tax=Devriesea agamarum TaxID=472569 RepID=UPI000A014870